MIEMNNYLKEKQPDIMGLVETKLSDHSMIPMILEGKYNIWTINIEDTKRGIDINGI